MNTNILGVLGGMGPLASAHFMTRLTLLTPASRDQDHIPTILWSDPRVPDRTLGRLSGGADPLPWLQRGIRGLRSDSDHKGQSESDAYESHCKFLYTHFFNL